jgi:hypothetical protein
MSKNGNVDISAHCGPRNEKFPSILGDKKRFENEEVQKRVFEASQVIVQSPLISPPLSKWSNATHKRSEKGNRDLS